MEAMTQSASAMGEEDLVASEYLTFTLGSEEYAIDILKVQEIRGYENVTRIASAPPFEKPTTCMGAPGGRPRCASRTASRVASFQSSRATRESPLGSVPCPGSRIATAR